ncbi:hypothetical protein GCM10018987_03340 [Streptomyces cremeus]
MALTGGQAALTCTLAQKGHGRATVRGAGSEELGKEREGAAVLSCQQAGQMALDMRPRST